MNPKRGKLGTCGLEGIKESPAKPPEVDLEFNTWLGVLNLTSWGTKSQFVALRFTHDTCLKSQQSSLAPRMLAFNAKSSKIPSLPKKAKQPTKWIFLFLSKNPREALTLIHHLQMVTRFLVI